MTLARATRDRAAWVAAGVLVASWFVLAVTGARDKSTTVDEIVHLTAGHVYWTERDYRLNPENGNLPQRFAAAGLAGMDLQRPATDSPEWKASDQWRLGHRFFYDLGNDPAAMLLRARTMIAVLGVLLGLVIWRVSTSCFGRAGGLLSLALFALDPTMLAHGRLVTSDLAAALFFLVFVTTFWRVLHRVDVPSLAASSLAAGGLLVAKMSGVLGLPIAVILVVIRFVRGEPWLVGSRSVAGRVSHVAPLALVVGSHAIGALLVVWASFGFRFSMLAPDAGLDERPPFAWELVLAQGDTVDRAVAAVRDARLLPEAWLYGFAHVRAFSKMRNSFLDGEYALSGRPDFFPRAFLMKTPLAILGVLALALFVAVGRRFRPAGGGDAGPSPLADLGGALYRTAPLGVLLVVYGVFSLGARINIGHRHLLPLLPPLYVLAGAAVPRDRPRLAAGIVVVAGAVLAVESFAVRPHYLAFFNAAYGGPSRGYRHLVDSSLDWGQDLPGLRRWLERNRGDDEAVFLAYFGTGDPRHHGIDAREIAYYDPSRDDPIDPSPLEPGIYAISATMLQTLLNKAWGPWTTHYESMYQEAKAGYEAYEATAGDPAARARFVRERGERAVAETIEAWTELRFSRLCAYLRRGEPDAGVGHSILIYRLDREELGAALEGPARIAPPIPELGF